MKKNGFTLIELIATMVLLAVLATILLVNMAGIKSNEEDAQIKRFKADVEEAACTYIDMSINSDLRESCKNNSNQSKCQITLRKLIGDDVALVEKDELDVETNKTAEEEQDSIYVQIKWINNGGYKEKKCEMIRR